MRVFSIVRDRHDVLFFVDRTDGRPESAAGSELTNGKYHRRPNIAVAFGICGKPRMRGEDMLVALSEA
jgi:hypothetical protein